MKKKSIILISVLLLIFIVVLICSLDKNIDKKETVEEEKIQIGMSFDSFVIERWLRDRDVFVSTAKELGAEVNVQNANGDIDADVVLVQQDKRFFAVGTQRIHQDDDAAGEHHGSNNNGEHAGAGNALDAAGESEISIGNHCQRRNHDNQASDNICFFHRFT